jgi:hypothetical protein
LLVILTLLLGILQVWWISFIRRDVQDWTFFAYLAFMVLPILLYLAAYLVLPADLHLAGDALAQAFIERRRAFQAIIALVPLASFVQQRLLSGEMPQADLDTLLHCAGSRWRCRVSCPAATRCKPASRSFRWR